MSAVNDQFHRYPVISKYDTRQSHLPLMQRIHAVEKVGAVVGTGIDRPESFILTGKTVAHGSDDSPLSEQGNKLFRAFEFGGKGHDFDQIFSGIDQI